MEWSFRVFRILGEHVIMEKRDAQKNILFHVRFRGLRYSKSSEICVMSRLYHCLSEVGDGASLRSLLMPLADF